jgi:hypothetical protein
MMAGPMAADCGPMSTATVIATLSLGGIVIGSMMSFNDTVTQATQDDHRSTTKGEEGAPSNGG